MLVADPAGTCASASGSGDLAAARAGPVARELTAWRACGIMIALGTPSPAWLGVFPF